MRVSAWREPQRFRADHSGHRIGGRHDRQVPPFREAGASESVASAIHVTLALPQAAASS